MIAQYLHLRRRFELGLVWNILLFEHIYQKQQACLPETPAGTETPKNSEEIESRLKTENVSCELNVVLFFFLLGKVRFMTWASYLCSLKKERLDEYPLGLKADFITQLTTYLHYWNCISRADISDALVCKRKTLPSNCIKRTKKKT